MNTLVDIERAPTPADLIAGISESALSPYFYKDIADLFDTIIESDETIICGYNITQPSNSPPFQFGYLILTSRQIISVLFESEIAKISETRRFAYWLLEESLSFIPMPIPIPLPIPIPSPPDGLSPKRPYIQSQSTSYIAVDYPKYPLTQEEKSTRRVTVDTLRDLINVSYLRQEVLLGLHLRFANDDGKIITLNTPNHARDLNKLLNYSLVQRAGENISMEQLEGVSATKWLKDRGQIFRGR